MLRRLPIFVALALFPAAVGGVLLFRDAAVLPLLLAAYTFLLSVAVAFWLRTPAEVRALSRAAAERESELSAQRRELQARVDFLSAEREIGLLLNEDVDYDTIIDRVLAITRDTLGGEVELWLPSGEKLLQRRPRSRGKAESPPREDPRVRQCFQAGQILSEAEDGRFHALAPLQADREIVGVVRVTTALEGDARARQERAAHLARHLEEFSKFLGLALKTRDLYTRAVEDSLTGLWTKRHFLTQAQLAMESSRRYSEPLSLIMADVDHFKQVNDTHGHVTGDKVLRAVADILRRRVRGGSAFRYGGEEIAILLPKADVARAAQAAERLRQAIEAKPLAGVAVTASFGVAEIDDTLESPEALVAKADAALYRAKQAGRNRVAAAPAPQPGLVGGRRWTRSA